MASVISAADSALEGLNVLKTAGTEKPKCLVMV